MGRWRERLERQVGVVYMKKRYGLKDYLVVSLMTIGLVLFMQADVKVRTLA
jgi:hypothetical protein